MKNSKTTSVIISVKNVNGNIFFHFFTTAGNKKPLPKISTEVYSVFIE